MKIAFANTYHSIVLEEPLASGEKIFIQLEAIMERLNINKETLKEWAQKKNSHITMIFGLGEYMSDMDYRKMITDSTPNKYK